VTLHVACAVEGSYLPHCAAMLHSVLTHRDDHDVHVHLLHGPGLGRRGMRTLEQWLRSEQAAISFCPVPDAWTEDLPTRGFTGRATWYRIFLADLLPTVSRVLFLDADVVVRRSLTPLWETPLRGARLAAVTNVFEPHHRGRPEALGLTGKNVYFNAGVLLMDLDAMRADDATRALREYAVAHADQLAWRDQDTLNVVLGHRRMALHPRWNVMNIFGHEDWSAEVFGRAALEEALSEPAIRHFEGPGDNKPWHRGCGFADRDAYWAHRRQTPWPRVLLRERAQQVAGRFALSPRRLLRPLKRAVRAGLSASRRRRRVEGRG
jgi:lipopolysaccharide biosynthesis glycosyltransferase